MTLIVLYAAPDSGALSGNGVMEDLRLLLTVLATAFVAVFFTIPALLSMFGHGGVWVKHVVLKVWKHLSLALFVGAVLFWGAGTSISIASTFVELPVSLDTGWALAALVGAAVILLGLFLPDSRELAGTMLGRLLPTRSVSEAVVELKQVPVGRVRAREDGESVREEAQRIQRLTKTLGTLDGTTEFVMSFREGRGRALFVATGRTASVELERRLVPILKAHLHGHRAEPSPRGVEAPGGLHRHTVLITGVPERAEDPLEPLARFFLESGYEGDYRVAVSRVKFSFVRRFLATRKQRALAKRSGRQLSESVSLGTAQRSTQEVDYLAEMEHEESAREVERRASGSALRVRVSVTGYGETPREAQRIAEGGASMLRGALSSHRDASALKARGARVSPSGGVRGPSSLLLPVEAAPYFWIPQVAMGSELAPVAEFELSPKLEGEVELGKVVVNSAETRHEARVPLGALTKHVFITGMTGSGKTTSCFNLLLQLYQLGVPFLVVEPVKSEYRSLFAAVPGLQVFTLGDESTAPFRLNIFEPPPGVRIQTHVENLEAVWNASFVQYAPLPYVVKEVLVETYRTSGWDIAKDRRGRPISLDDFLEQSERVSERLGYEPKLLMDIRASLGTRIRSLRFGGKAPMFDTVASIPLEDLLRRPTVIELKSIAMDEEKAFVASLVLMNVMEYLETKGNARELRHLTLVEEAHRLLPNISSQKGDPEASDPRKRMVEQFANMLAEIRAYGEGLAIVEQIPTKIIPDAVKNTATKIAHRVPAADDREVLAGAMNLTGEQAQAFAALKPGEAIVSVERHPLPIRIKVPDAVTGLGIPLGQVGDGEVRDRMAKFYLENPLPKPPGSILSRKVMALVDVGWFRARFLESYEQWLRTGDSGPLVGLLVGAAGSCSRDEDEKLEVASKVLSLAVASYLPFDEKDREKFPRMFMQEVRKSVSGDARARR